MTVGFVKLIYWKGRKPSFDNLFKLSGREQGKKISVSQHVWAHWLQVKLELELYKTPW